MDTDAESGSGSATGTGTGTDTGTGTGTDADTDTDIRACDDGRVSDEPQIQFFQFKARTFCTWFDTVTQSGQYDGIRATHVVSGLVASAAKLMRIRNAGRPFDPDSIEIPVLPPSEFRGDFPVECRSDWAEICKHRERTGGLPGCLAEVRRELRDGFDLLEAGRPYDAVSHWQLGYVHNWGELAICALMMLHADLGESVKS
jgi:hypothetical protein